MERHEIELADKMMVNPKDFKKVELGSVIGKLITEFDNQNDEITRLKAGKFTPEEFQNICHKNPSSNGMNEFCNGCDEYQRKLFGSCRTDLLKAGLKLMDDAWSNNAIKSQTQKVETQQTQEVSFQAQTLLAAAPQHPPAVAWCCTPDCVGGELVEPGTPSHIQESEASLSGLRSPCERC